MADTIAKGAVVIGANTAGLESGLKKAQQQISGFATSFGSFSFFSSGPMGGAIAGIKTATDKIQEYIHGVIAAGNEAEKTLNTADAFGIPVEQFQVLAGAAGLAGVEIDTLEKGFKELTKTIGDARLGKSDALISLERLGLDPQKTLSKGLPAAFDDVANAISKMPDPLDRAAAAIDIFGKAGIKILPALTDEARQMQMQFKLFNLSLARHELEALDKAGDEWSLTLKSMEVAWKRFAASTASTTVAKRFRAFTTGLDLIVNGNPRANDAMFAQGDAYDEWLASRAQMAKVEAELSRKQAADYEEWVASNIKSAEELIRESNKVMDTWGMGANEVKAYALEMKGLDGEQLKAAYSAAQLADNIEAARNLFQQDPVEMIRKQMAGIDAIFVAGASIEQRFAAMGQLAQNLIDKANVSKARPVSALVAGSNEDIRNRIQAQMEMQMGTPADQMQAALKELGRKFDQQVELGRQSRDFLKKIADRGPVEIDAR